MGTPLGASSVLYYYIDSWVSKKPRNGETEQSTLSLVAQSSRHIRQAGLKVVVTPGTALKTELEYGLYEIRWSYVKILDGIIVRGFRNPELSACLSLDSSLLYNRCVISA